MAGEPKDLDGIVDQSEQVMVLRLRGEFGKMHPADRQHDPARRPGQRGDGAGHIRHPLPGVAGFRLPRWARQGDQRHTGLLRGLHRVGAHLRGKRVGGIHQMGDGVVVQIRHQPRHAAKAANAHRDGLLPGTLDPAHIGQGGRDARIGQGAAQGAGLGRAAKDKDIGHG